MTTPAGDGDEHLRELAKQLADMSKLGYDPSTIRKGVVAAVSDTTNPPTVSLNLSGDADTLVTQVRTLNNYTPVVGQTVLIAKQGTEIFLLGAISSGTAYGVTTSESGWIKATLTNGSHNGNSNGDVYYRRILDHGAWKMQWQGGWSPSGSTTMIGSGDALDSDFRPTYKRSIVVAREIQTGATAVQFDFNTSGTVTLIGGTTAPSVGGSTSADGGFFSGAHVHSFNDIYGASGEFAAGNGTSADPGFSISDHAHSVSVSASVTAPGWVSLNNVEYFL